MTTASNPPPIDDALAALAANHRWTWHAPTRALLDELPEPAHHPVHRLRAMDPAARAAWAEDRSDRIADLYRGLESVVAAVGRPEIAYFSPEFGIAAELQQYSGGLGVLAGDHLKAASDLGLPLIGIGLFYREGFFHQEIQNAHQLERYERIEPEDVGADDTGVTVTVRVAGEDVEVRVWKQMAGATALYLLDTDQPANSARARTITDRLYSGDRRHRLDQELVLGVGGVRALRALDIDPAVFHLNEGHACFLLLELLAELVDRDVPLTDAIDAVRARTLFTTHTPVPAGIDRFDRPLITPELRPWAKKLGIEVSELLDWALLPSDAPRRPFNTAAFAFELCGRANGVSQLHAEVSRELFSTLPRAAAVEGITNGVHAGTWVDSELAALYDRDLGRGWENGEPEAWARVADLDLDQFRAIRKRGRADLVQLVADRTGTRLDADRPVLGFARRFATYKRAALMLRDPSGLRATLDAGAQFVFAGKAHPADIEGKAVLTEVAEFADSAAGSGLVIVPDYDIGIARTMYAGCDVWLNNPVRPREASGTSGEKSALNGGLNCSILDGWWADWFVDGIGWAIPVSDEADPDERDDEEARNLTRLLVADVLPAFADQGEWWSTVRRMLAHLGPRVTAGRMVAEYENRFYGPIRDR